MRSTLICLILCWFIAVTVVCQPTVPKTSDAKVAAPENKVAAPENKVAAPESKVAAPENKVAAPEIPEIPDVALPKPIAQPTAFEIKSVAPVEEELYVLAQRSTHVTPFGGVRLTWITGELAFDSPFGGRSGTKLDIQDDLFVSEDQWGTYFGIDVQHSYFRISLAYGFNQSESVGNIPREVIVADSYLQSGAKVATDIDTHWFTGSLGYTILARDWGGIGAKLSFNYIYIRSSTDVQGYLADDPTNPAVNISLDDSLFIPMPTIGAYIDWAPHDRWVLRGDIDFIFYDIVNRQLTTLDCSLESRYYFMATQDVYCYFKFQYEYFHYEFDTSKVRGFYDWHSFLFLAGVGINF